MKVEGVVCFNWEDGSKYEGEWKNGMKHGKGIYFFPKSSHIVSYEGYFYADKFHGKGKAIFKDGDVFEGECDNGTRCGKGKYVWKNGAYYEGNYKNNRRDGYGIQVFPASSKLLIYEGEWVEDKSEGKGKLTWKDGKLYEGDFKNGFMEGEGIIKFDSGNKCGRFEGQMVAGKFCGDGILTWKDSNDNGLFLYRGTFENGKKHGKGIMIWFNYDVYEGEFKDDKMEGKGILYYHSANGEYKKYEGEFVNNKKHGQGKVEFKNGDIYEGEWKNDIREGVGEITYSEKDEGERTRYIGDFLNNHRTGKGKLIWRDGQLYEGDFVHDVMQGFGILSYCHHDAQNRSKYIGRFRNNQPHGDGKMIWKDGKKYEGVWSNGEIIIEVE